MRGGVSLALLAGLCACDRPPPGPDPFGPAGGTKVYRTVQCVHSNADGTCNKLTCKKDEKSDCTAFVKACLKNDHHSSGTSEEASCSRVL